MNINIFSMLGHKKHFPSYILSQETTKGCVPRKQGNKPRKKKVQERENKLQHKRRTERISGVTIKC